MEEKQRYRNPFPTVDIIIERDGRVALIERKNTPFGWALPGGFVNEGESVEQAAVREAKEETGLDVALVDLLYVYSDPRRDPRHHTLSVVFVATARGTAHAGDDARSVKWFRLDELPTLVFDHRFILDDYLLWRENGRRPTPRDMLVRLEATSQAKEVQ